MEEEPVRALVHPVRVLDDDQRRRDQHPEQELLDGLEDALAAEGGLDLLAFRRRRDLGVEGNRQQREQGHELGHHGLDPRRQARAGLLRALGLGDAGERPQQRAEREVGHGDGVLVAARGEVREPDGQRLQLLDEPRLADAGLADQLGNLALAHACRIDGCAQLDELLLTADDRQLLGRFLLDHTGRRAHAVGRDRALLALDEERLRRGFELRARALEHLARGEDLARLGACGQARGEVDGVAHHGVGAAGARADVACEGRAAVDAGPKRQGGVGVEDRPEATQHPLLVRPGARRSPGRDVELAAVDVDVRLEPREAELRRHAADGLAEPGERLAQRLGAALREQRLDARELHERGRHLPVLRLAGLETEVGAERGRHEGLELQPGRRGDSRLDDGRRGSVGIVVEREQGSAATLAGEPLRPHRRGRCGADEDLARVRGILEPDRRGRGGPGDDELPVARIDEEEVAGARVDAGRHAELDLADGAHHLPARALDEPLHLGGRRGRRARRARRRRRG